MWQSFPRKPEKKSDDPQLSSELYKISKPSTELGEFLRVATLFRKKAEDLATTLEDITGNEQDLFDMPVLYNIPYEEWLTIFKHNYEYIINR